MLILRPVIESELGLVSLGKVNGGKFLGLDGRNGKHPLLYLVVFVLHCNVGWLQRTFEGLQGGPRIAIATARRAVKLHSLVQPGCVNSEMACRNEGVDTYSTAHNIVADSVN